MKKIIAGFKEFGRGYLDGIDMIQGLTKQPKWVCWLIAMLTLPFNIIIMIGILIFAGWNGLRKFITDVYIMSKES